MPSSQGNQSSARAAVVLVPDGMGGEKFTLKYALLAIHRPRHHWSMARDISFSTLGHLYRAIPNKTVGFPYSRSSEREHGEPKLEANPITFGISSLLEVNY